MSNAAASGRPRRRLSASVARGMLLRCPRCGARGVRRNWFKTRPACPTCGLVFDRGERDYWYGSYALNYVAALTLSIASTFALVIAIAPDVNWRLTLIVGLALAIGLPAVTYPFAQMLWLAVDVHLRPNEPGDSVRPS